MHADACCKENEFREGSHTWHVRIVSDRVMLTRTKAYSAEHDFQSCFPCWICWNSSITCDYWEFRTEKVNNHGKRPMYNPIQYSLVLFTTKSRQPIIVIHTLSCPIPFPAFRLVCSRERFRSSVVIDTCIHWSDWCPPFNHFHIQKHKNQKISWVMLNILSDPGSLSMYVHCVMQLATEGKQV